MTNSVAYSYNTNSAHHYHLLNIPDKYSLVRPVSNMGDYWLLGCHSIICADGQSIAQQHQQLMTVLAPRLVVNSPVCCHHLAGNDIQVTAPCRQSIEKIQVIIENNSQPQDIVLDLFAGCGATLVACENTRRRACLVEVNPFLVDRIIQAWQLRSGKIAIHKSSGWSFNELLSQKKII